jgi:hypothetical protein
MAFADEAHMMESLDRWITGNYGEDGWVDEEEFDDEAEPDDFEDSWLNEQ